MTKKLPQGADQQGRYPEAAEACTDIMGDERPEYAWPYRKDSVLVEWFIWGVVILTMVGAVVGLFAGW